MKPTLLILLAVMMGCAKPVMLKSLVEICGTTRWQKGQYWAHDKNSVKNVLVCDKDGRELIEVEHANPFMPNSPWSVCSGTTGDCYGEFADEKSATARAESEALGIARRG